jgi:mannosyltransferase OCH1-like enzyme
MSALAEFDVAERRAMTDLSRAPVPRVIHQIWLGTLPVPQSVERWQIHAQRTGFEYRLWREADLERLGADRHPAYLRMLEIGDYPGAVDIARYAILQALGGIYLDCDWYPTRDDLGFADLLPLIGLGAMAETVPRETGFGSLLFANSFIAAPAGHPVFGRMLAEIPQIVAALPDAPAWWSTGPLAMTVAFRQTSVSVAPSGLVAAELPRKAPLADVEEAGKAAVSGGGDGLLIAWKSW